MDQIRQAVERAKAQTASGRSEVPDPLPLEPERVWQAVEEAKSNVPDQHGRSAGDEGLKPWPAVDEPLDAENWEPKFDQTARFRRVNLAPSHLEKHRIVAHNIADPRSKAFDILRTQVLQTIDQRRWQFLAVTSPTKGCGTTATAINLALSIARQSDRSVLLVDMDLPRPSIATCLGMDCKEGVLGILEGRTTVAEAVVEAHIDGCRPAILASEAPTIRSSELITSRAMSNMLHEIKRRFAGWTVIFDLPPMLDSDDVMVMLPRIDCVLLVAAVSTSTVNQIKECNKHLHSTHVLRLVLNKAHRHG